MVDFAKKLVLIFFFIAFYFFILRSGRAVLHDQLMGTLLPQEYGAIQDDLAFHSQSTVSFMIFSSQVINHGWQYKMPFGSFFLFAMIGLMGIKSRKSGYIQLTVLHAVGFVIGTMAVWIGINGFPRALILTDFISRYLVPVGSLGLVAISLMQKKNEDQREY